MILTVTANTSIDHILFVPSYTRNKTLRVRECVISMGGKPTDCAWILGEHGIPTLALGFIAGHVGDMVMQMLHEKGVQMDFVTVEGESRRNILIIDDKDQSHTTLTMSTLIVHEQHIAALREKYIVALNRGDISVVVLGGTLPAGMNPDLYADFITLARERDIPTIFDASGKYLEAGIKARPTYIKPNEEELLLFTGEVIDTFEAAYHVGRKIIVDYGTIPIISLGVQGGLAVLPDRAYYIPPLKIPIVNPGGAGDGILAGLAWGIEQGESIEVGIRMGFANAAATVMMPGTAQIRREDALHLREQIELIPYAG